jgi:hypothetical protein
MYKNHSIFFMPLLGFFRFVIYMRLVKMLLKDRNCWGEQR